MNCANCDSDALYVYQVTESKEFLYCGKHLPGFLEARRKAGNLKTTEAWEREKQSALTALKPVVIQVTKETEEPVVEEVSSKKKAPSKKKAK
mgnify:CR=1 FL=1